VVGLNFHQSKEVLIHDTTNGIGGHYDVRISVLYAQSLFYFKVFSIIFIPILSKQNIQYTREFNITHSIIFMNLIILCDGRILLL
jgi:hypothetical protein